LGVRIVDLPTTVLYRITSLEYYNKGLSPAGARIESGRFNRHGLSALYLSFDHNTGLAEYYRSDPPTPAVVIPIKVKAKDLIEIGPKLGNWPKIWQDWHCDWELARDRIAAGATNVVCNSWDCGQDTLDRNCAGIIFPSMRFPQGRNIVLFTEDAAPGRISTLRVMDPKGEILKANPAKRRK
jgi:RES domain-containing protein